MIFDVIRVDVRYLSCPQQAITQGYSNAFSTIADAIMTTVLTVLIVFYFCFFSFYVLGVFVYLCIFTFLFT
ncbi:protein translocase subunit SecD, partial [Vibrio parahaemolyticus]|nr:protein translocase subunit SecD [Vibrio parahaemolyticus]